MSTFDAEVALINQLETGDHESLKRTLSTKITFVQERLDNPPLNIVNHIKIIGDKKFHVRWKDQLS